MRCVVEKMLNNVFDRYFCPETSLIYEYTVDKSGNAWHHLPTPSDIQRQYPNPCGWGTGMEDSVLNGGTLIDALVTAYEMTKDWKIKEYCDKLLLGMLGCAKEDGFIARSLSPFDLTSYYAESSRDQYTHWIYGAVRFYFSELCDGEQRKKIERVLCQVADKCEREVKAENNYSMLRADGTVGIVNKMWGDLGTHEWLRLPMFYLAAFAVSGKEHYKELYLKYRDEGLENSKNHKPRTMRCYASLQMQCSLRFIYDYDADKAVKQSLLEMMKTNAIYGEETAITNSNEYTKPEHREELNYTYMCWNEAKTINTGSFGGYTYINPGQNEHNPANPAFYPVREVGEGAIVAALCPEYRITESLTDAIEKMALCLDVKNHSSVYAPLLLSCAHILCKTKRINYM